MVCHGSSLTDEDCAGFSEEYHARSKDVESPRLEPAADELWSGGCRPECWKRQIDRATQHVAQTCRLAFMGSVDLATGNSLRRQFVMQQSSSGSLYQRWARWPVVLLLGVFCILAGRGFAQSTQGFSGMVTDHTGAALPNAKVTVHNDGTGVDKVAITTSGGTWSVPFLQPGLYDIRAEADKFASVTKTNLKLVTDQTLGVDFSLSPGNVTESITVNASDTILDYTKADRGLVLDNQSIEELPTNAGNSFNFAYLAPGFMSTTTGTSPGNQSAQTFGIHGASVEFNIDGVSNQSETGPEHYTFAPPVEALQEFKITDNAYDAAAGRSPGGQIDMTLKTGTKTLHGAAWEYLQRSFLNANSSTNDAYISLKGRLSAYNKAASTQNQYGFELDGPVVVPKLWGGNRQSFFTILYEDLGAHGASTSTATVPTAAMAQGDFSSLLGLTVNGAAYNGAIYDPATEAACTANNTDTGTYAAGNPHVCRYQFGYGAGSSPGPQGNPVRTGTPNVIPTSRLSPVAQAILSWYPSPNQTPTASTANPYAVNYVGRAPGWSDNKTYLVKFDQVVGAKDTFGVTGKLWKFYAQANNAFARNDVNSAHPGINQAVNIAHYNGTNYRYPSLNVSWTHTVNSNFVNTFRGLITTALESDATGPDSGYDPVNLGFTSAFAATSGTYFKRFPYTVMSNFTTLGSQATLYRGDDAMQLIDIMNWTHGKHVMHFGGDVRFQQYSQKSSSGNGVNLYVSNSWTQQWDANVTSTVGYKSNTGYTNNYSGNSIASMLLGTWDNCSTGLAQQTCLSGSATSATTAGSNYYSSHYGALYFQDDWRFRPNLTINLGVRWEDPGAGLKDRFNRLNSTFDTTTVNPVSSQVSLTSLPVSGALLGGPTWAGVGGNPEWEYNHTLWQFGPRVGFAYTLNAKTVIRGGMGLMFNDQATGNQNSPSQLGYATSTGYSGFTTSSLGSYTLINPAGNMANPFPSFQTAKGNCSGDSKACLATNAGQSISYENRNYHPGEVLESSFGIQRQFTAHDTVEVSYAGTRSYSMAYSDDINHISSSAQAACDPLRGGVGTNCTSTSLGYMTNPFYGLSAFAGSGSYYTSNTIQKINFTRPYPIFTSVTANRLNGAKTWYNALEVIYDHRTAHGLTTHVTYGYSKAMTAGGYADTINRIPSRTISSTDAPHRIAVAAVYQLPIAKGKGLFPDMPRVLDLAVGGWQVSGVYIYQSGLPQSMSGWIIDTKANGGHLLPRKRFWGGNSNTWYSGMQSSTSNSYVQRMKPCVATTDPNTGAIAWIAQSQPLVTAGLCSTPNYIKVGTYGATPNIVYSGVRYGANNQLDMNVSKNFKLVKSVQFQMRIDAFNALNHLQQTSSGFGTSTTDGYFGLYQFGTSGNGNKGNRYIQIDGRLSW